MADVNKENEKKRDIRKFGQNKYNDEYVLTSMSLDEKGSKPKWRYVGEYIICPLDDNDRRVLFLLSLGIGLLQLLSILIIGIKYSFLGTTIAAIPYVILFVVMAYYFMGVRRTKNLPKQLEHKRYDKSIGRLAMGNLSCIIDSFIALLISIIMLVKNFESIVIFDYVFIVLLSVVFVSAIVYRKLTARVFEAMDVQAKRKFNGS